MHVAAPYLLFSRDLDLRILVDMSAVELPLSGREVAARIGASEAGVREALDRLVLAGVVSRTPIGRSYAHRLNRDHVAMPAIEAMRGMRKTIIEAARDIVDQWKIAPVHASFFGSFARRDGDTASDLDILLVSPSRLLGDEDQRSRWDEQVAELDGLNRLSGNPVQILDLPEANVLDPDAGERAALLEIAADEIALTGTRLASLLRRKRLSR